MEKNEFSRQVQNENVKNNLTGFLMVNLKQIFNICSKKCVSDFKNYDLSDKEKICLSRCFDRKNESFQMSTNFLEEFKKKVDSSKSSEFESSMELK